MKTNNPPVFVIIPAAGSGTRLGGTVKKQFLELDGISILERTVTAFSQNAKVTGIVVVAPEAELPTLNNLPNNHPNIIDIVVGGRTRAESVAIGVDAVVAHVGGIASLVGEPIVLIHDAARCLVSQEIISNVIEVIANEKVACGVAMPISDTVRRITRAGHVTAALPSREELVAMQTPQGAPLGIMLAAQNEAKRCGHSYPDDIEGFLAIGYPVKLVMGDLNNFKITLPNDLKRATDLLQPLTKQER